ncbi:MAG: hypothetical protein IJ207_01735 [Treponema sp.]|uniref:hypothetical protein n=1 Tax=Treponema sp. TaxID=166 RepID=UPI0025F10F08|nr:hypothetical protein [Treponema sp.]MBQ9280907.1 hypothetical protein [Treponema sp.]
MINTYNESSLHATLKKIYALQSNGIMEVRLDDTAWICDILDENGNAIEIQTSNLSALTEKSEYILETGRKLKIVHPIAETKWIELYDSAGNLLHKKKSPKKASIYDSLRGMTQICPLFLHENCCLEILYCEITEMRRKTENPAQIQNRARRHLKDWLPMGKRLEKITRKEIFSKKSDWQRLLPSKFTKIEDGASPLFYASELQKEMKNNLGAKDARWASLLIWILVKMGILELRDRKGRINFYTMHNS